MFLLSCFLNGFNRIFVHKNICMLYCHAIWMSLIESKSQNQSLTNFELSSKSLIIMLTCPCNVDSIIPHFYIVE